MTIQKRLLVYLAIAFILASVIVTLTHEFGHYIVAKYFGYEARISYAYTYTELKPNQVINSFDDFFIRLGGPIETMLTGTIGLMLLFYYRKSFVSIQQLSFGQWILIFVSLFWLRQPVNFIVWMGMYFFTGQFSNGSDEIYLAQCLEFPSLTISILTGIVGLIVLSIVIFKFIPLQQRFTFFISGLVGGILGYIIWLDLIGKILMP